MKNNIGIWIDTKQAVIIKLSNNGHTLKKVKSNIETRERVEGEGKKFGRFGGQFLSYEKHRENKKVLQTNQFFKHLLKEIGTVDGIVLFGPAKMKKILEREINNNILLSKKFKGSFNSEAITKNQMIAWVKEFFKTH